MSEESQKIASLIDIVGISPQLFADGIFWKIKSKNLFKS